MKYPGLLYLQEAQGRYSLTPGVLVRHEQHALHGQSLEWGLASV